jgi:hypothetical protein
MTDRTPRPEAERAYLAIPAHEDDSPRHEDDYEASWFIRGYEAAAQARAEALREVAERVRAIPWQDDPTVVYVLAILAAEETP